MRRSGVQRQTKFGFTANLFDVNHLGRACYKMLQNATNEELIQIYQKLYAKFGPQYWWPGDSQEEIIIGAILTQSTSWKNVERAIINLKKNNLINFEKILKTNNKKLAAIIKSAGYNNQKAKKLKSVSEFFLNLKNKVPTRSQLLEVHGIGPETADSILLYAYNQPEFVVDAYTKRIFSQLKLIKPDANYQDIKNLFESKLPGDAKLFNEYHALIVRAGKELKVNRDFLKNI